MSGESKVLLAMNKAKTRNECVFSTVSGIAEVKDV
jgi:hypothetical protein